MDVLVFNEDYIKNLVKICTANEKTYKLINEIIANCSTTYVSFISDIIMYYSNIYKDVTYEINDYRISKLHACKKDINIKNIKECDLYNLIYNPYDLLWPFNDFFYDMLSYELTKILNTANIIEDLELIEDSLDCVFKKINSGLFLYLIIKYDFAETSIIVYPQVVDNCLFLNVTF